MNLHSRWGEVGTGDVVFRKANGQYAHIWGVEAALTDYAARRLPHVFVPEVLTGTLATGHMITSVSQRKAHTVNNTYLARASRALRIFSQSFGVFRRGFSSSSSSFGVLVSSSSGGSSVESLLLPMGVGMRGCEAGARGCEAGARGCNEDPRRSEGGRSR